MTTRGATSSFLSRLSAAVLALLCASTASTVRAAKLQQAEVAEVAIWPEYDRAEVLVTFRFRLPAATTMPATVPCPLPAGVDAPHAVAKQGTKGGLFEAPYETGEVNGQKVVWVTTDMPTVHVEAYAPLQRQGDQRRYQLRFTSPVDVTTMIFEVQQPRAASALSVKPAATQRRVDRRDGLTYQGGLLGTIARGDSIDIELSYENSDGKLSVDSRPAAAKPQPAQAAQATQPAQPAPRPDAETTGAPWSWFHIVVFSALVGLIAYGFGSRRRGRNSD